jgi:hypothetical protein
VQLKHIGNMIRGKEDFRITGEDGLRTLVVAQAVLDSRKAVKQIAGGRSSFIYSSLFR